MMNNYFMETHHHEWILTNKSGGYALGTGNLINQRKYHGLLIASDRNFQRNHLVAGIEEKVEWRGDTFHLDSNNYSNCVYPEGFLYLVKPWLRPYPVFLYSSLPHQNDILILKELFMDKESNTILVKYTNLGHHKLHLELRPKFTMLNHHEINQPGSIDNEAFETRVYWGEVCQSFKALRVSQNIVVYGSVVKGEIKESRNVYYNVFFPWEVMKGYPGIGEQISLFVIDFDLAVGESNYIMLSDHEIEASTTYIKQIRQRYMKLPLPHDYPKKPDVDYSLLSSLDYEDNLLFSYDDYLKILEFALKDFISNNDIVAGYPWYGSRGRDTMVVLNALLRCDGSSNIVEDILVKYREHIKNGLIPNRLPESGTEENYESVDATLWYVILLYKFGKKINRTKFWVQSISSAEQILCAFLKNTYYPFHIREDGLIELHTEFSHATWMDICLDGNAITPRNGAPVEINALWYNAICAYEEMLDIFNQKSLIKHKVEPELIDLKDRILESFQKFWLGDYLADRLIGNEPVTEFRPNALLATSLPWKMLTDEQLEKLFLKTEKSLLTKYGIRTLSPESIKFRKKYYGSPLERDLSYHNGSSWAWLLGSFCGLYIKIYSGKKPDKEIRDELSKYISTFRNGFMKGHIASVAELWDGDSPHFPKGAPAMAWSVAALYNIETYICSLKDNQK